MITITNKLVLSILLSAVSTTVKKWNFLPAEE